MNRRFALCAVLTLAALPLLLRAADDPVELDASDDTWLNEDYTGAAQKRGEADEMQIYPGKTPDAMNRGLIKFDIKKIAPGFKGAILRLTAWNFSYSQTKPAYFRCHPITNAWNQETATWDIRSGKLKWAHLGGDFDPKAGVRLRIHGTDRQRRQPRHLFRSDRSGAGVAEPANPSKCEGVAIMLEKGCSAEVRVRTKEFGTESNRPKLMLYYQKAPQKMAAIIPADQLPPFEPFDPAAPAVSVGSRPDTLKINEAFEVQKCSTPAARRTVSNSSPPCPPIPGL